MKKSFIATAMTSACVAALVLASAANAAIISDFKFKAPNQISAMSAPIADRDDDGDDDHECRRHPRRCDDDNDY
ncbi:MAG TPA: hypothetical protein VL381_05810 [Rhodocyclaceae bacterium]|nr:hypothetical protein [Rhodocyclaceae bacterium]